MQATFGGLGVEPAPRSLIRRVAEALEDERPRWFYWVPVFVGCGSLIYFLLAFEPSGIAVAGILAGATVLRIAGSRGTFWAIVTAVVLCGAVGLAAAKLRTEYLRAPILAADLGEVKVSGRLELVEARGAAGQRLTIKVLKIEGVGAEDLPARVRVSARKAGDGLLPGDLIKVTAKLSPPPPASVPGGYDFARYAYYRGIGGVGYATRAPVKVTSIVGRVSEPDLLERGVHAIARLRQHVGERVKAALPGQTGALANALITGDRSGISEETNEAYRASGLFHILSISGLHMAIMGGAVFFAFRFVLALFPVIALNYPIKKWAAIGAILGSSGYLMISGGSFATVRSFLMIAVMFASILADRSAIALRNVALAALVILLFFPESVVDPGFQMSFAAVVALVASYEMVSRRAEPLLAGPHAWWWRGMGFFSAIAGSTLVASAAVAPLGIYHFHQTQLFAVLANLLAVPICNVIVMPAALGALLLMPFGGEGIALAVMGPGLEAMGGVASWIGGLQGAVGRVAAIPALALALIMSGGLWLCLFRARWRLLGAVLIAAGVAVAPWKEKPDLLIGDEGRLVVMRDASGAFAGLTSRYSEYELNQWLARDGDVREAREVGAGDVLRCDPVGCAGIAKGLVVTIARHASAVRDDCWRADILIAARGMESAAARLPHGGLSGRDGAWADTAKMLCPRPQLIVTREALRAKGTHAVSIGEDRSIRIETVADVRGARPWSLVAGGR